MKMKARVSIFEIGYIFILLGFIYGITFLREIVGNFKYPFEIIGIAIMLFRVVQNKYSRKHLYTGNV